MIIWLEFMTLNYCGETLVIGGSRSIHGSVILTGLTQLKVGVERVQMVVPKNLEDTVRLYSPNFIVFSLPDLKLTEGCVNKIVKGIERGRIRANAAVIGADMSGSTKNFALLSYKLSKRNIHLTINSRAACKEVLEKIGGTNSILVLDANETRRIVENIDKLDEEMLKLSLEKKLEFILVRESEYRVYSEGEICSTKRVFERGKRGITHIISGLISGLIAKGLNIEKSIDFSLRLISKAEEMLIRDKRFHYLPEELIDRLSEALAMLNP